MEEEFRQFHLENLSIKKYSKFWLLEPELRLDLTFADNFFHQIMEKISEEPMHVLIDMNQVPYISSSGIKAILKLKNFLEMRGYKIALFQLTEEVNKIVHISELHRLLPLFNNREDAIAFITK